MRCLRYLLFICLFSEHAFSMDKNCTYSMANGFDITFFLVDGVVPDHAKDQVNNALAELEECSPAIAYKTWGEINQFGLLGEKNIIEAINFYNRASELGDFKSHYYLGTIYFSVLKQTDIGKALYHTEIAAKNGIKEAITNLFFLKEAGHYSRNGMLDILEKYADSGDDDIEILYAKEKYYSLINSDNDVGLLNLLNYLLSLQSENRLKDVHFLTARLYLNESFSAYSKTEGLKYLELAAQNGHAVAPDLIKIYSENKR